MVYRSANAPRGQSYTFWADIKMYEFGQKVTDEAFGAMLYIYSLYDMYRIGLKFTDGTFGAMLYMRVL